MYLLKVTQEVAESGSEPRQLVSAAEPLGHHGIHLTLLASEVSGSNVSGVRPCLSPLL